MQKLQGASANNPYHGNGIGAIKEQWKMNGELLGISVIL